MADAILAQSGIYKITNIIDGKLYVGSAIKLNARWALHGRTLRAGRHHSVKLQRAWNKHGAENFKFEVIEIVLDRKYLLDREQVWLDALRAVGPQGYNICPTAGSPLGRTFSDEIRAKLSASMKARPKEMHARAAAARVGLRHSEEAKRKIGDSHRGRKLSAEHIAQISARIVLPETREKLSVVAKNRSREHIEKIANANRGKKLSAETIAKRQATWLANGRNVQSEETKRRRSATMTGVKKSPEHIAKSVATQRANRQKKLAESAQ